MNYGPESDAANPDTIYLVGGGIRPGNAGGNGQGPSGDGNSGDGVGNTGPGNQGNDDTMGNAGGKEGESKASMIFASCSVREAVSGPKALVGRSAMIGCGT
ncbi:MAG: hypothetical protein DSY81_00070 [Bacillota bacterium]|nr:MAG: hypothetical protein DSY81_00070 [Bacillota bacterium]